MRPIVCPSCLSSPNNENPTEVIIYSKPHKVSDESYSPNEKHKSARSQIFPNRNASSTTEKPLWSIKQLIRRIFGDGNHTTKSCCQRKPNVNCYRRKVLVDVERKHKIMQRDVVRARRAAYGIYFMLTLGNIL